MVKLHIDIETYSPINISAGTHRYAEKCELLMMGYAFGDSPAKVINLFGADLPDEILDSLSDPGILKIAHNAAFERSCISKYLNIDMPAEQWFCSMVYCAITGLPLSLDKASKVLNTGNEKDSKGKALIRYFCIPQKPTKKNPLKTRNYPDDNPEKWAEFMEYCRQDVETERSVTNALSFVKMPKTEKLLWNLDQRINDKGVTIDQSLVRNAISLNANYHAKLLTEAKQISELENPNSVKQLIGWINDQDDTPINVTNLKKTEIPDLLEMFSDPAIKRLLIIRQELSKTSVKKYNTMKLCVCRDGTLKGLFQFAGAGRTWRWGGRSSQPHNLPKGHFNDDSRLNDLLMDGSRELVLKHDTESIEMIFGAIPDLLSKLLRTAFKAKKGYRFLISDFSAIEARVIAWLAGEQWRLDIFNGNGKIYEASAAKMFKVPIEEVTKGSSYRARGKIAELALGFGGSVGALLNMIKSEGIKDIDELELPRIVAAWRKENPKIVDLWLALSICSRTVVNSGVALRLRDVFDRNGKRLVPDDKGISMEMKQGHLIIRLPSGRPLCYYKAHIGQGKYGHEVRYWGLDQTNKKWVPVKTYGGKLTENIVQAIARDCLANGMLNLDDEGYNIVMHVHDEVVCECPLGIGKIEEINELMTKPASWMGNLPLKAVGFESIYYKKD